MVSPELAPTDFIIDQILVGRFRVFTYLITDPVSKEALLLDPGADARKILGRIRDRSSRVRWIVCTHAHPDHMGGTQSLRSECGAIFTLHEHDALQLSRWWARGLVRLFGGRVPARTDATLRDRQNLSLGQKTIEVLHTPGHTAGSICLYTGSDLFTGDTLFVGGVGRTDLRGGSSDDLARSLLQKIFVLPAGTRVWPGHDYGPTPSTNLETEARNNPFVRLLRSAGPVCEGRD